MAGREVDTPQGKRIEWSQPEIALYDDDPFIRMSYPDKGIFVSTTDTATIGITLNDGRQESSWDSDPGALKAGTLQHVVITVDGGPKIITFVVNGILCDGGNDRQFGWGRFSPTLRAPNPDPSAGAGGAPTFKIAPSVRSLRLYSRALRTSEAVGSFRAGCAK
jgi:hypothetical protein